MSGFLNLTFDVTSSTAALLAKINSDFLHLFTKYMTLLYALNGSVFTIFGFSVWGVAVHCYFDFSTSDLLVVCTPPLCLCLLAGSIEKKLVISK